MTEDRTASAVLDGLLKPLNPDISQTTGEIPVALINTPLQRGESGRENKLNRFNGFDTLCKTAEAVRVQCAATHPTEVGC